MRTALAQYFRHEVSLFTAHDIYLFKEGNHFHLYKKLGAYLMSVESETGTLFAVWAPNAKSVSVIGDFNRWEREPRHARAQGWLGHLGRDAGHRGLQHWVRDLNRFYCR